MRQDRSRSISGSAPELTPLMRGMLWLGALLVTLAGIQLYFFSTRTDKLFAWTIDVPVTAAFLGAFYWTSLFLAVQSAIQKRWAMARVGLVGVQVFLWLTLVATLLHLDRFHLTADDRFTRGAAWLWLIVYIVDPPLLTYAYLRQVRLRQQDPPRHHPTPPDTSLVQSRIGGPVRDLDRGWSRPLRGT